MTLRCGLNSCHYHIYAMRKLPKFARIPQGHTRSCLFTAIFGFLDSYLKTAFMWRCHGWLGGAAKFFPVAFKPNEALRRSRTGLERPGHKHVLAGGMVLMLLVQTCVCPSSCSRGSMPLLIRSVVP